MVKPPEVLFLAWGKTDKVLVDLYLLQKKFFYCSNDKLKLESQQLSTKKSK